MRSCDLAKYEVRSTKYGASLRPAAEGASRPAVKFPITGFWMDGAFTKRPVQID